MTFGESGAGSVVWLNRLHSFLYRLILLIAGVTLVAMLLHVVVDVFFREAINLQLFATIETVSNYYMVAITYLCIALAQIGGDHIEMSMVMAHRSKTAQNAAMIFGALLAVVAYGFLAYVSVLDAAAKTAVSSYVLVGDGRLAVWPAYWLLPVGFAAMVLTTITTTIVRLQMGMDYRTIPQMAE